MATTATQGAPAANSLLTPVQRRDAIDEKLTQAAAICGLLSEACSDRHCNLSDSAWAAQMLIREAKTLMQGGEHA